MIREQQGWVSIWLDTSFEEDNEIIGWFDHDYSESAGGGTPRPLRQLLQGSSYSETWIDQAIDAAAKLGITEAGYAWMLFDHVYNGKPGPVPGDEGGYFIGAVKRNDK